MKVKKEKIPGEILDNMEVYHISPALHNSAKAACELARVIYSLTDVLWVLIPEDEIGKNLRVILQSLSAIK